MAEPVTTTLSILLWEYALKPVADSIKKEYGEEAKKLLKSGLQKAFEKLPLQPKEQELIETEIIKADVAVLSDQEKFMEFIENNQNIKNILNQSSYSIGENYGVQHNEGNVTINNYPK
jgi:hypothetical protein